MTLAGIVTVSFDIDAHTLSEAADALEFISDAIAKRLANLPHTSTDPVVDGMELNVPALLDRSL